MKFAFVILHFNALDETIKCIESIRALDSDCEERLIIIVDNASPNGTGTDIARLFGNDKDVHVILSDVNGGFSYGNNLGFEYAKYQFRADFIVMCNNDIVIQQSDFLSRVIEAYNKYRFAVLGPRVENPGGYFRSNPSKMGELPLSYYFKKVIQTSFNYLLAYLGVEPFYRWLKNVYTTQPPKHSYETRTLENVQLHGCFWVFSRLYIDLFDGINNKTFMYGEEPLLLHRLLINNLTSLYMPSIHVYHKEDAATESVKNNPRSKRLFMDKYIILSHFAYIKNYYEEKPVPQ